MTGFYTYLHCRPDGTPFYVGKGKANRCRDFSRNRNPHYKSIVEKYGKENILAHVFPCDSEHQAFADEVHQIAQLRRDGHVLCNMTDGGEGNSNPSSEVRAKISASLAGRKFGPLTDEHKAKIAAANKGTKPSEACKEAARLANTGRKLAPFTVERRARMSAAKMNPSPETRAKKSAAAMGKAMSPVARAKMSAAKKGRSWTNARRQAYMDSKAAGVMA